MSWVTCFRTPRAKRALIKVVGLSCGVLKQDQYDKVEKKNV
jgi:hypothetical protein